MADLPTFRQFSGFLSAPLPFRRAPVQPPKGRPIDRRGANRSKPSSPVASFLPADGRQSARSGRPAAAAAGSLFGALSSLSLCAMGIWNAWLGSAGALSPLSL